MNFGNSLIKSKGGRPPVFKSPEQMEERIIEYFQDLDERNKEAAQQESSFFTYPTVTGLALFLGFSSRQSFYDYKKREQFSYIIKKAATVIESHYENRLNFQGCAGAIFALKNMGWKDKTEVDQTISAEKFTIDFGGEQIEWS